MPSSKIANQYARRARITPIQTNPNNIKSNAIDLTSEEVYSLINTTANKPQPQQTQPETTNPVKKSSFLKILLFFVLVIIVIGSCVYVISLKDGVDLDEGQSVTIRRHSIVLNNVTESSMGSLSSSLSSATMPNALQEANTVYGEEIQLPESLENIANVMDPVRTSDVPTFWHIPRAGGSTVKDITTTCLNLVQASQVGAVISKDDTELKVVEDIEGGKFMNVDTTTPHGINRAVKFGLAASSDLDLIVTPYVYLVAKLFDDEHRGRMFTVMRHPIDRAVSLYYAMKNNKHTKSMMEDISLESYAKGSMVENNWMTRFLANQQNGELSLQHEILAKEILRQKFLIGLLKYKDTSMSRFESYFGWKVQTEKGQDCHERLLDWNWSNKNLHPIVDSRSNAYKLLEKQNEYDIRLYEYAERLFHDQEILFEKDGKRKDGVFHKPLAQLKDDHH